MPGSRRHAVARTTRSSSPPRAISHPRAVLQPRRRRRSPPDTTRSHRIRGPSVGHSSIRVGLGYDSHRFAPGGPLVLGGVAIDADVHLHGHSDGDAVAHALTDAILGAAAAGDIGEMFSDHDPRNAGRDSIEMLGLAVARVRAMGWRVCQVDVAIVAERPRIAPHREAMRARLASALGIETADVSIKGKSNEGMGWIGRGEGLACMAVVTLADGRPEA